MSITPIPFRAYPTIINFENLATVHNCHSEYSEESKTPKNKDSSLCLEGVYASYAAHFSG